MDGEMQQTQAGEFQVVRRLEAFAGARLSPTPAAVRRMRARVMREARAQFDGLAATPAMAIETSSGAASIPGRRWLRRTATVLLAAALSLAVVGGTTLAAAPGGPLYGTALWIEEAMLPAGGEARAHADLARLEHRLEEAAAAAANGNAGGVAAALDAYRGVVDDALALAGKNVAWATRLETALGKHLVVLNGLMESVPDAAEDAIEQAIVKSSQARDRVHTPGGPGGPSVPGGLPGNGRPGEPGAQPEPARTPRPNRTPPPNATPRPVPTPVPEATPPTQPETTPRPTPRADTGPPASPGRAGEHADR